MIRRFAFMTDKTTSDKISLRKKPIRSVFFLYLFLTEF